MANTDLKDLVKQTVDETLEKFRLDLTIALTTVAMATLDKAQEIQHDVIANATRGGAK